MVRHMVDGHNPLSQLLGHDISYVKFINISIKRHMNLDHESVIIEP
jgi:hypothetical protein